MTLLLVASAAPGMPPAAVAQVVPGRVYVANFASDTVSVIDTATNTVIATVPVGDGPRGVGVTPDATRVYVANEQSDTVSVIDTATNAVVATVAVGDWPTGVRATPDGTRVWVTNAESDSVSIIDTGTNAVVATVPVGIWPIDVAFSPDGARAYVTSQADTVSVLQANGSLVTAVPVGHTPTGSEVLPNGSKIYVANQSSNPVSVIAAATNTVVATIPVDPDPTGVAVHPNGSRVYVATQSSSIEMIDTSTDTVVDSALQAHPRDLVLSPAGDRLYVGNHPLFVGVLDAATLDGITNVGVGGSPDGMAAAALRAPVIGGSTWYTSGAKSRSGPAGSAVALYAVGAAPGVPYRAVLSRTPACADLVAHLNPTAVVAGASGLIGTVRGTIPAGTPAGTYWICFRHTAGATATGVVSFTVA